MHIYSPKEFQTDSSQKDKPLQRSFIVQNTFTPQNSTPIKALISTDHPPYHILKKSTSTVVDYSSQQNLTGSFVQNSSSLHLSSASSNNSNRLPYEFKTLNNPENPHYKSLSNINSFRHSQGISQTGISNPNRERRLQENGQPLIHAENIDIQMIINKVTKEIKEKHLPEMLKALKKDFYDDLHALRVEFNRIKEEQQKINDKMMEANHVSFVKKADSSPLAQTYLFLLQEKITNIQTSLNDKYEKLNLKFQKEMQATLEKPFNIGNLKSSIPNIKLEYKECFIVKHCDNKSKINQEIIVSLVSYNVDKLGYLLDSQNRYILDSRGFQIRLEERHLKLLEQHKILYK